MSNYWKYAALIVVVGVFSYYGDSIKRAITITESDNDEYEMVKKYLLNDSPLYGYNKPKIWIHTKYELNARKWRDFYSRNSYDLNQPYIHLTTRSIIQHCSDDFHICLIDDETFSKLIPTWDIHLPSIAEPLKTQYRQLGLAQLVYFYGGMVVPNSFLCKRSLKALWDETKGSKPFVCEAVNRSVNLQQGIKPSNMPFVPDMYFFGAQKNSPVIKEYVDYLQSRSMNGHITSVYEFLGDTSTGAVGTIRQGRMSLVGGEYIGIKTNKRKPVLIEDLMEDNYLDIHENTYGIYIPEDELLIRPKFSWFCVCSAAQIMEVNSFIANHLKTSLMDSVSIYKKTTELNSATAI